MGAQKAAGAKFSNPHAARTRGQNETRLMRVAVMASRRSSGERTLYTCC
jgi:hypothetical protein